MRLLSPDRQGGGFAGLCPLRATLIALGLLAGVVSGQTVRISGAAASIVLISGDEEYRSEEALPQLARILSEAHHFRCTVLFAIDPASGFINPDVQTNIPGLEALDTADLMIIATRMRDLPDDQMQHIVRYIESGKPIIGIRTATHAFALKSKTYANWNWNDASGGFGRTILGETWIKHHGEHGVQSTRGIFAPGAETHPILRGIRSGELWSTTDVYETRLPLPDVTPLVLGQVLTGMDRKDPAVEGAANEPMRPIAWIRTAPLPAGRRLAIGARETRIFTTTLGTAEDLVRESFRRLLVNAVYWALGREAFIFPKMDVSLVGDYDPSPFGFHEFVTGRKPSDYGIKAH